MSWVMAGVAVVGGGIKLYQGAQQKKAGRAAEIEARANRPEFEIPIEEQASLLETQKRALTGIPDAQRRAAEQDIQRTSQAAMRSSHTRRGGLGMISKVSDQESRSNLALMNADAQMRRQNVMDMMKQRSVIAGYKNKRFEHAYNEYTSDLDYARAQIGAGIQNQQSGIDNMLSGAGQGLVGAQNARLARENQAPDETINPNVDNKPEHKTLVDRYGGDDRNIFTGKQKEQYKRWEAGTGEFAENDPYMNDFSEGDLFTFRDWKKSSYNTNKPWWKQRK